MTANELNAKAYEIISKLIEGFIDETKEFKIPQDREVLDAVQTFGIFFEGTARKLREESK